MGNICEKTNFPTKKAIKADLVHSIELDSVSALKDLIHKCITSAPRDGERMHLDEPIMFKNTVTA
jgi:hypothetical protein